MPGQPTRQPQRGINPTVSGPMDSRQDPLLRNVASILSKMWGVSETIANKTIDLLDNGKWDKSMSAVKIASIINKDPSLRERARVAEQTKIPENPDTFAECFGPKRTSKILFDSLMKTFSKHFF